MKTRTAARVTRSGRVRATDKENVAANQQNENKPVARKRGRTAKTPVLESVEVPEAPQPVLKKQKVAQTSTATKTKPLAEKEVKNVDPPTVQKKPLRSTRETTQKTEIPVIVDPPVAPRRGRTRKTITDPVASESAEQKDKEMDTNNNEKKKAQQKNIPVPEKEIIEKPVKRTVGRRKAAMEKPVEKEQETKKVEEENEASKVTKKGKF